MGDEALTSLGALLEHARGGMSKREASRRAGISEGRWRQVVTGQQKAGGGIVVPANPRRETVIAMAKAVGADVDEALRRAGMREEEKPGPDVTQPQDAVDVDLTATTPETVDAIRRDPRLMEEARRHLLRQYEMLAQLSDLVGSNEVSKDARPETPVVPAAPSTQRPLRAVARKRPSPRPDKP